MISRPSGEDFFSGGKSEWIKVSWVRAQISKSHKKNPSMAI